MPDLNVDEYPSTTQQWIGRAAALIYESGGFADLAIFKTLLGNLTNSPMKWKAAQEIAITLYVALGVEMQAPISAQGAFIPAGNAFDAFAALSKVFGSATNDILIVDPYLDEKVLTDFAALAQNGVSIRLLADEAGHKATLSPASQRWAAQYGGTRPLEIRLAPARTLHDRVIIADSALVWILTQSLNAFAARSPATIVRADHETAPLKITAYDLIWLDARPI